MFWHQLIADILGLILILASGGAWIYICWRQRERARSAPQKDAARVRTTIAGGFTVAALIFAAAQTVADQIPAKSADGPVEKRVREILLRVGPQISSGVRDAREIEQRMEGTFPLIATRPMTNVLPPLAHDEAVAAFAEEITRWRDKHSTLLKSELPHTNVATAFEHFTSNVDKHRPELYEYSRLVQMRANLVEIGNSLERYARQSLSLERPPS